MFSACGMILTIVGASRTSEIVADLSEKLSELTTNSKDETEKDGVVKLGGEVSGANESDGQEIEERHEHEFENTTVVPTCDSYGYTLYFCACGEEYIGDVVSATGHNFGEWEVVKYPTCEEEGEERRICLNNETHVEKRTIRQLAHEFNSSVTLPTCETGGYTTYTCSKCGETYKSDVVSATGHDFGEWEVVKYPTCNEEGEEVRICRHDEKHLEKRIIPKLSHNYVKEIIVSTCYMAGYTVYTCSECGHSFVSDYSPAYGHDFSEWAIVRPATCKQEGEECRFCINDETHIETRTIPKLSHSYVASVVKPTCEENGYTLYVCSECGDSFKGDFVSFTGHEFSERIIAPSCEEEGYLLRKCERCGKEEKTDVKSALGHSYGEWIAVSESEERRYCSICGKEEKRYNSEQHEHDYTERIYKPTCVDKGYTLHICSRCGDHFETDFTEMIPHDFEPEKIVEPTLSDKGYTLYRCKVCGATEKRDFVDYEDTENDDFLYEIADGKAIIIGLKNDKLEKIVIPSQIDGYSVIKIAENAFKNNLKITSCVISDGVEEIGDEAFSGCKGLMEVKLGKDLNKIGILAFKDCDLLNKVDYPIGKKWKYKEDGGVYNNPPDNSPDSAVFANYLTTQYVDYIWFGIGG